MAKKVAPKQIEVQAPAVEVLTLTVVGDTSLVVHKFSEKAKKMMLRKQMGLPVVREKKDPEKEYRGALYLLPTKGKKERYGVPATAFKKAMASAGFRYLNQKDKVSILGGLFIIAEETVDGPMLEIVGRKPVRRMDAVRLQGGVADLRFRPEFKAGWKVTLQIRYNSNWITPEKIVSLLQEAGSSVGICEHRSEKGGQWGIFHVELGRSKPRGKKAKAA